MTKQHAEQMDVDSDPALKAAHRRMWASGDYHRFAKGTVWNLGETLVRASGLRAGQRVLDVAAGTGNTAIRAAQMGARVIATDLTPEHFDAGRREARDLGVDLDWMEADAEALPFDDAEFDVVTSSFGAMFAPRHQVVADEMVRVCRPGGTIAMINFTPEGLAGDFFGVFVPFMPPPAPGSQPPLLWGNEAHVRDLFGDRVQSLEMTRHTYVERASSPRAYYDLVMQTFGPAVAIRDSLAPEPQRQAALDAGFMDYVTRSNSGAPGETARYAYEYLLVIARRRNGS